MPSRKKDRGKQRKAAKQNAITAIPKGHRAYAVFRNMKTLGCRINPDGIISNPCLNYIKGETDVAASVDRLRNFDRELLSDEERQELAENYVYNYGQDLREGGFHGTGVVISNMVDPHLKEQLSDAMVKANIHSSMLYFLNQSDKSVSDVLGRVVDADNESVGAKVGLNDGEKKMGMPYIWVSVLRILMQNESSAETWQDARLTVAKGIGPFVMTMIDNKRELFQSNLTWHVCLAQFFDLVRGIMMSKDGFLAMISYEGFLPFVAQASCWSQSREDIATESESLRQLHPDIRTSPEPLSLAVHEAHRVIATTLREPNDVVGEADMRGALDQIACTPLLSDDPNCNDSTMAGLIRMLDESSNRAFYFECIIQPLLLTHGYVDKRVISELIKYGKRDPSIEATEFVLSTMVAILGRDDDYDHIEMIDSRYAAAVRHGLLEFSDALIAYDDESDCEIADWLYWISYGLCLIAMHSKTSRALRERKEGIAVALEGLKKISVSQSNEICNLIDYAFDLSAPATCCNCLKEVDRKKLLFCKRCGVECYCSLACQKESYALGHDELCKEEVEFIDSLREDGLSKTELKRMKVLNCNLVMNGCRILRSKAADFLDEEEGNIAEVTVDFGECPPDVEVSRSDEGDSSDSLKCTFISPVYYGFADRVDLEVVDVEKVISRRSLERFVT